MHRGSRTSRRDDDIDRAGAVHGGIGGDAGGVIDESGGGDAAEGDVCIGSEAGAGDRDARGGSIGGAANRGEGGDGGRRDDQYADLAAPSVNQRLPSGPAAMPSGALLAVVPVENSVTAPAGVIRPIWLPTSSVNQRLPSGPAAMPYGLLLAVGMRRTR